MRAGVAWFALLALALPGFASLRGLCCDPGLTESSDCCASAMKMPGMDSSQIESSQMESVTVAALNADHWVALTATQCAPSSDSEILAFLVRSEGSFDGSLLFTRDVHPALARNWDADLFSGVTPALLLVDGTSPRISLSDPLSLVLRI
jgi:hypothetical protein